MDSEEPMLRALPVDLEELAGILEGDPLSTGGLIDIRTGEVWAHAAREPNGAKMAPSRQAGYIGIDVERLWPDPAALQVGLTLSAHVRVPKRSPQEDTVA